MRSLITLFLLFLVVERTNAQSAIYDFKLDSISGSNKIDFAAFKGKKILIVNTASGDSAASQYNELKQLKQLFKDSLIIVVVPSNSFNSEIGSLLSGTGYYDQKLTYRFPVAAKLSVLGTSKNSLYQWLTKGTTNGVMDQEVIRPFQKFLINRQGKLTGVFGARERPMSAAIRDAIERGY